MGRSNLKLLPFRCTGKLLQRSLSKLGFKTDRIDFSNPGQANSMSFLGLLIVTDVRLVPTTDQQPDGHFTVNVARLPAPLPLGTFPINMATNQIAPQLVLEVAVSNENMPILVEGSSSLFWTGDRHSLVGRD
jgi:hypothetical protein